MIFKKIVKKVSICLMIGVLGVTGITTFSIKEKVQAAGVVAPAKYSYTKSLAIGKTFKLSDVVPSNVLKASKLSAVTYSNKGIVTYTVNKTETDGIVKADKSGKVILYFASKPNVFLNTTMFQITVTVK